MAVCGSLGREAWWLAFLGVCLAGSLLLLPRSERSKPEHGVYGAAILLGAGMGLFGALVDMEPALWALPCAVTLWVTRAPPLGAEPTPAPAGWHLASLAVGLAVLAVAFGVRGLLKDDVRFLQQAWQGPAEQTFTSAESVLASSLSTGQRVQLHGLGRCAPSLQAAGAIQYDCSSLQWGLPGMRPRDSTWLLPGQQPSVAPGLVVLKVVGQADAWPRNFVVPPEAFKERNSSVLSRHHSQAVGEMFSVRGQVAARYTGPDGRTHLLIDAGRGHGAVFLAVLRLAAVVLAAGLVSFQATHLLRRAAHLRRAARAAGAPRS